MKKVFLAIALLTTSLYTQAQNWTSDKAHSMINFTVSHMVVSDVDGSFKDFDVQMTSNKADFSDAKINMTIKSASINTDNEKRDAHLKSADFFDVEKYNTITFESTSIKSLGAGKLSVTGKFTMHGITKTITLIATHKTGTNLGTQKTIAGFKMNGKLSRKAYSIGNSTPTAVVGDEVSFKVNLEMVKE